MRNALHPKARPPLGPPAEWLRRLVFIALGALGTLAALTLASPAVAQIAQVAQVAQVDPGHSPFLAPASASVPAPTALPVATAEPAEENSSSTVTTSNPPASPSPPAKAVTPPSVTAATPLPSATAATALPSVAGVPRGPGASSAMGASSATGASSAAGAHHAAGSAHASGAGPGAASTLVRIRDRKVFPVQAGRGGQSAEARARAASLVLEKALEEKEGNEVRVEEQGEVAVIFVGKKPLIQLGVEDVTASGDASLGVHAAAIAGQVRDALDAERQRSAIAKMVFSISVLIFSALVALLLAREVGRLSARAQRWLESNPERVPELRFRGIEVIRGAAWRGLLALSLVLGRVFVLLSIAYAWLLVALSLFDSTRPFTDQLSGIVFSPLSSATQRVVGSLPALVVASLAIGAALVAVRFVRIFFGSVERGEADPGWVPRDFARATGFVVRAAVWLGLVLFVLPTLTGSFDGALSRAGAAALLAMGLGAAPLLASAAVGLGAVYGRRLRPGTRVEIGGRRGRVTEVTLTEVRLEDDEGREVRVPHLLTLARPTSLGAEPARAQITITVSASTGQRALRELLLRSASSLGGSAEVELTRLDADGAHYRVTVRSAGEASAEGLACALADALNEARVPLGRGASGSVTAAPAAPAPPPCPRTPDGGAA